MTLTRTAYDTLLQQAQVKANELDQPVAVVTWGDGEKVEFVTCHKGYAGAEDMTKVNELLEAHKDAELLEMVGPTI
jgi:hypothetical protein